MFLNSGIFCGRQANSSEFRSSTCDFSWSIFSTNVDNVRYSRLCFFVNRGKKFSHFIPSSPVKPQAGDFGRVYLHHDLLSFLCSSAYLTAGEIDVTLLPLSLGLWRAFLICRGKAVWRRKIMPLAEYQALIEPFLFVTVGEKVLYLPQHPHLLPGSTRMWVHWPNPQPVETKENLK